MDVVYVILTQDRHSDPEAFVAEDREAAINTAKRMAKEYCRYEEDYEERSFQGGGLIFTADYSCESDSVSVIETTLINPNTESK